MKKEEEYQIYEADWGDAFNTGWFCGKCHVRLTYHYNQHGGAPMTKEFSESNDGRCPHCNCKFKMKKEAV